MIKDNIEAEKNEVEKLLKLYPKSVSPNLPARQALALRSLGIIHAVIKTLPPPENKKLKKLCMNWVQDC